ncbi:MAG: NHLP leader peptide family RiPP precursor [Opitutales bacterium]|nr:NHLP leader peptide family RiPP precursor [Opitutales bacterium]MCH8539646.1 NHLP leader peptide family RiPP precursor [Opitutales bacterium]
MKNPAEFQKTLETIYAQCAKDKAFRQRFVADPKAVIQEQGIELPSQLKFKVVENQKPNVLTLHLPPKPTQELSDEELESVAGGTSFFQSIASTMFSISSGMTSGLGKSTSFETHTGF